MELPVNQFKAKLRAGKSQIGLWCGLPGSYAAEIVAPAGFDWLLFDTEHSPSDVLTVLPQLQAVAPYQVSPVVRPAVNDPVLIKRFLDIGVQTLLIPYIQNAEEARAAVDSTRYPPAGIRGVSALTRATRFGRVKNYAQNAVQELCVLVQVETREALAHVEAIASVDGVDGVFIGPADLAASFGYPGQPGHPEVVAAIEATIAKLKRLGVPAGILTPDETFAARCIELGTLFTAVGVDVALLARGAEKLADRFAGPT
ncbi:4-hydroxy-2-oxoheptanedioate aldolase [Agrobacterium tumefaciens]|jgi:4-hydroxy-2-oxoheptanedioate aldolase|uniref:4-hydroxy-2-oxo-heptane-1,7-dioate aldolase n=1 Tax=Agrobacterium tumefaciens TaxID=358 RepID=A0A2L2LIG4_AGRTU|nr:MULTISPECIES: 4-hydroxy-2-oxoheptanedioate aldolase [Agrobacterium]MCZ7499949.1 4-hydroxy-2-oxoheptanedioate aldolase [Rhizobium rhizogenes]AVH44121.1 4-hydroxy-2-oxo-heptane-1,7-dioate aldolase [Agrobacterium tumefaciens]NSY98045.1 4-hydroxy-2-oxoheptanedioate aldolase [Agrobacterium tumefaciens]NSZ03802.1 4-hydroxy-2-oxoheptanedioate aldolase [Agrobacterium tumefaciens]NSZ39374.1 4-hydroxy-2-oxoheptanedioate aldolase [Agrobacterium tumefaciens]